MQARRVAEQRSERADVRAGGGVVQRVAPLCVVHRQRIRAKRQQVRRALRMPANGLNQSVAQVTVETELVIIAGKP